MVHRDRCVIATLSEDAKGRPCLPATDSRTAIRRPQYETIKNVTIKNVRVRLRPRHIGEGSSK